MTPIPLHSWLAIRRRRKLITVLILTLLAALTLAAVALRFNHDSTQRLRGSVTAIVDALTLDITPDTPGSPRRVRLLGLNCPPTWQPAATAWLRDNLLSQTVTVSFDHTAGTNAGFVYRAEGQFINQLMLDQGLLQADPTSDHALASWFSRLHGFAQHSQLGQWNTSTPPDE